MILLGSIQRLELIKLIDKHIGRERRLQVAARWQREAQERAMEEQRRKEEQQLAQQRQRRPSRFEVIPAPDILKIKQQSNTDLRTANEYSNHKEVSGAGPGVDANVNNISSDTPAPSIFAAAFQPRVWLPAEKINPEENQLV